jgi:hypothetical protein
MKFQATVDKKYSVWQRLDIEFEAKDENEANELLAKWDGVPPDAVYLNTETLYDTEEELTPEDNGGQPVHEVISEPVEA